MLTLTQGPSLARQGLPHLATWQCWHKLALRKRTRKAVEFVMVKEGGDICLNIRSDLYEK